LYFKKKLYQALNVPTTRLESDNTFNLGRSNEITRDELKFAKFIQRLRHRFSFIFNNLLEIQLALKGIMKREEWEEYKNQVQYNFLSDNHFEELKDADVLTSRIQLLSQVDAYLGKYFSKHWVQKNVLRMTEEETEEMDEEIQEEGPEVAVPGTQPTIQGQMQQGQMQQDQMMQQQQGNTAPEVPEDDGSEPQPLKLEQKELSDEEKQLIENMSAVINNVIKGQ
jgi:Bacteriophage T4-like portal protein (Gp20)